MAFHVKFNWQQQSAKLGGWSMNFWSNLADMSVVLTKADELRTALNNVTGAQVICSSFTVSSVTPPRQFENIEKPTSVVAATATTDADYPSTALFLKNFGAGGYSTGQWIRGIPDANISNSGMYNPTSTYSGRMGTVFGILATPSNGWSMYALNKATEEKPITNLALATGIVSCPAHGYGAAGATLTVRIMGFSSPRSVNRVWRITVIDENSFQLSFWHVPVETTVDGNNPVARRQIYIFVPIASSKIIRATSHYTGRPTGLLGGRRKKKQRA